MARFPRPLPAMVRKRVIVIGLVLLIAAAITLATSLSLPRSGRLRSWIDSDAQARRGLIVTRREVCPGAPFVLPADGSIGLLYGDPSGPYSVDNPHQGIDIFSNSPAGVTPVYAAYDGYVYREESWRSALIQRIPEDPLDPGQQIWLYYAHMADRAGNSYIVPQFPPGVRELFVKQGTLLGYTGDYNGDSLRDIWVHLHFSIVRDNGRGQYQNELEFENTIDPSPYFGMPVQFACEGPIGQCNIEHACVLPNSH